MSRKTERKAIAKLEALYAQLPHVACRRRCFQACGPVPMSTLESERVRKADAQKRLPMIRSDASCIYLTADHACGVYAARPLVCRVFGTAKNLSCPHGCLPDRWLSTHEFLAIAQAVERLGGPLVVGSVEGVTAGDSWLRLDATSGLPREVVDRCADITRGLRALHGGRILAVAPGPTDTWLDLDHLDHTE